MTASQRPTPAAPPTFCSDACRAAGEPLFATATRADVWLLLEYTGRWGAKALEENALPQPVRRRLSALEAEQPHTRIQFIKRTPPYPPGPVQFFVALAHLPRPALYRFELSHYADLLDLDIEAILSGDPHFEPHRVHDPLYLVCTNSLRDACCAKYGLEVYNELAKRVGGSAWQTTHLGGHRFAPILLVLPQALHYGRVKPGNLDTLVRATVRGEVLLPRYRGRTIYDRPVQAAEHFLREATGRIAIDAFALLGSEQTAEGEWSVRLAETAGDAVHRVRVAAETFPEPILKSCSAAAPEPVEHFRLIAHEVEGGA